MIYDKSISNQIEEVIAKMAIYLHRNDTWLERATNNYPHATFYINVYSPTPDNPTPNDFDHANRMARFVRDNVQPCLPTYTISVKFRFSSEKLTTKQIMSGILSMMNS